MFLIEGATRGAVLNTNDGNVYSINGGGCSVISGRVSNEAYWQSLMKLGLAEFCFSNRAATLPPLISHRSLDFVWFEIVTEDCNQCCLHCYAGSMPPTYRKERGLSLNSKKTQTSGRRLTHQDWQRIISEIYEVGCRKGQLIGGEPFLYQGDKGETVLDIAEYMMKLGYNLVEIYTNATLITPRKIARIKELGIEIAISLYSSEPLVHDYITKTPGSYALTVDAIKLLVQAGVRTRVETVLMKANQHTIAETLAFKKSLGVSSKNPDPLRPNGRGDNLFLQPDFKEETQYGLLLKPDFRTTFEELVHNMSGNSCLAGKVAISEFGEVFPCIFGREQLLGSVIEEKPLHLTLQGEKLERMWKSSKDDVLVCQDCEYRYVCPDCRPLSFGAAHGRGSFFTAPYPRCTYNPYTGEWANGLWKIDEQGNPCCDRKQAEEIQEALSNLN